MNENYNNQTNVNNQINTNVNQMPNANQTSGNGTNMGQNSNNQKANDFIQKLLNDKPSLIGYIGSILVIIANFLPFVVIKASLLGYSASDSFSYASTTAGKIVLVLAIASIVLIALKKHVYAVLTAGIAVVQFVYNLINLGSTYKETGYYSSYVTVKWGIGIYLTLLGLIGLGVSIFLYWKKNPNCFKEVIEKFKGHKTPTMGNQVPYNQSMPNQQAVNQPVGGMQQPMPNQQMPVEPGQPMLNNQNINNSEQAINTNQTNNM